MKASFERIMREPIRDGAATRYTERDERIFRLAALEDKSVGEIRSEIKGLSVEDIGKAVRAVRDVIRGGAAPKELIAVCPDVVADQLALQKAQVAVVRASPALLAKLNAASKAITKPKQPGMLAQFVAEVKEKFSFVIVPLTMRKLAEAVEAGDHDAIKLSTQVFSITPTGGKGAPSLAQQFNFGSSANQPQSHPNSERQSPFFEQRLRAARERIAARSTSLQATDMAESDEDEDDADGSG